MTFHPAILALHVSSILILLMILYSTRYGIQILRKWDIKSGSELQLSLERKTYLISTLLAYAFGFQLFSLFLFIFTADDIHVLFVGAMCAAGSLYVNGYGYPALLLKILNFLLAGVWLIMNDADNRAIDYPLIKNKYLLLLIIAPFLITEMVMQWNYFLRLNPDVITSCCGTLFSADAGRIASEIASLPSRPMKVAFYFTMALTVALGFYFRLKGRGGYFFSALSIAAFILSILSILSFISLYYYELPTHHCPFCILQKEYGYIGYPLYFTLLGAAITGMGVGGLMPFRKIGSLSEMLPSLQKRLALISSILFIIFAVMVTLRVVFSDFILEGH
jgi:putative Ca2+/H+ antiporter (TMEM165/GDT1 family)